MAGEMQVKSFTTPPQLAFVVGCFVVSSFVVGCASTQPTPGVPSTSPQPIPTPPAAEPSPEGTPQPEAGTGESPSGAAEGGSGAVDEGEESPDAAQREAGGSGEVTNSATSSEGDSPEGVSDRGSRTSGEEVAELDRELDESLTEFDGMIHKENEVLAEKRSEAAAAAASSGSRSSGSRSGGGYPASGESSASGAGRRGARGEEDEEGFLSGDDPGDTGDTEASRGGNAGSARPTESGDDTSAESDDRVPEDVGDGSDDDIVARQLREAAMAEEDPELREKLWEEYRQYKRSSGSGD